MAAVDTTTTEMRDVFAPAGMAWVDAYGDSAGHWESVEEHVTFDQGQRVRYAEPEEHGGAIVRVPADEPAALADVMELAAEVESLKKSWMELHTALTTVYAALGFVLGREA